jgi:hypothetical protein
MEYKRVWLKYNTEANFDFIDGELYNTCFPSDNNETSAADNEISKLLIKGWKIVSTCPVTASKNILTSKGNNIYLTFTSGIEVFMVKD